MKSNPWSSFWKQAVLRQLYAAGLFALCVILSLSPGWSQTMRKSSLSKADQRCMSNLRDIHRLLRIYLHQSAGVLGFPSKLESIYGMSKDPTMFICPLDKNITAERTNTFQTSYEIVNDPLRPGLSKIPACRIAIVAEKNANHDGERFVLFYDGSVRLFDKEHFDELKKNSYIDAKSVGQSH